MSYIIKKKSLISEIAEKSPKAIELLMEQGLHCAGCFLGQFERLEEGAKLHGMTDEEIEKMVKKINKEIKREKV